MSAPAPFDARLARLHRARAAAGFPDAAFLHARGAADLAERLEAIPRRFERALVLGAPNLFVRALSPEVRGRIGVIVRADAVAALGEVVLDPENLPFAEQTFDLIVSPLVLHTVNDLPGALVQLRRALKPDGLFLAALFAGETLHELRACLIEAESELRSGAGPRVAPFADMLELAGLLQRAGLALPAADREKIIVRYAEPLKLLADLRAMGETNALTHRAGPLTRGVLFRALALYRERFADPDGRVRATFEVVTLTGWAPHESQQKPLKPGSAKTRLADALGAKEAPLPRE
ncbi:MAG: methyltransferase domain-containing protein [Hyphomonadaceae bacterium]|nr:methyltransferase domain-containing protein [Hyphomonadaceae bacterium]